MNLHTYQELDFNQFLSLEEFINAYKPVQQTIADFITMKDVDFAFFQEAGQHVDDRRIEEKLGVNIKKSNYVKILTDIMLEDGKQYDYAWDFSHHGFGIWEEGLGIVSKYEIVGFGSRYVSNTSDAENFTSRRIVRVSVILNARIFDLYCAHFNWQSAGFEQEFIKLLSWIEERKNDNFIIAGDFNVPSSSQAYKIIENARVLGERLIDCWKVSNPQNPDAPTFKGDSLEGQSRIDYILIPERFQPKHCEIVLKEKVNGLNISDHFGLFCEIDED
ncbi:MAG: endonuclease/exonuclease/phosphatase family protein [Fervidobacterium sp.]